jgi:hypothetical protein
MTFTLYFYKRHAAHLLGMVTNIPLAMLVAKERRFLLNDIRILYTDAIALSDGISV